MTTHRAKFPRFCCGYFRLLCVCAFVWTGLEPGCFFLTATATVDWGHVKIPGIRYGYFRTVALLLMFGMF